MPTMALLALPAASWAADPACTTPVDLRGITVANVPRPEREQQAFAVVPRIGASVSGTDNAREQHIDRQPDMISIIAPGITVSGQTQRACLVFDYSPEIWRYVEATDQNRVAHNLFATGSVTLVPDLLSFDARGSIAQESIGNLRGPGNSLSIPLNQQTQTITYTASPIARHQFGSLGELEARYQFGQTIFNNQSGSFVLAPGTIVTAPTNAIDHEAVFSLTTGPDFGKLASTVALDVLKETVTRSPTSTTRGTGIIGFEHPVWQQVSLLGNVGYEHIVFDDLPIRFVGPIGGAGFRFTPNPANSLSLVYGRHEGKFSFLGDLRYTMTSSLTWFATYSETLSTVQQRIQRDLQFAARDQFGRSFDVRTGLPLDILNRNIVLTDDVFRIKSLVGGMRSALERNTVTLSGFHEADDTVTGLTPNQRLSGASVMWDRQLTPLTVGRAIVSYAILNLGDQKAINVVLSLTHLFSPTLTGGIGYSFFKQFNRGITAGAVPSAAAGDVIRNEVTISLTKFF